MNINTAPKLVTKFLGRRIRPGDYLLTFIHPSHTQPGQHAPMASIAAFNSRQTFGRFQSLVEAGKVSCKRYRVRGRNMTCWF